MDSRQTFTNTFQNGMSSDANVVFQPDGTYPYMKNCSLVSQDGNNYVIKDCIGNTFTFAINEPYDAVYTVDGALPKAIAFISFPDKLIVLSTNNNSTTGGYGEIGMLKYLPYGEGIRAEAIGAERNPGYIPLYHSEFLTFSQLHKAKGVSFVENELLQRIYWTDNFNEIRVFNTANPIFTTYIATGSLVVGRQYMVLQGAITHNATNYGPGIVNGNVFTAANANYTDLTSPNRPPFVIEYYPYELLDATPSRLLGQITFDEYGNGDLYCGSKIYYYRLSNSEGVVTSWSYGSAPVLVGTLNESTDLTSPTVAYQDFVGGGTSTVLLQSNLSVSLTIDSIDTNFDFIEVACAEFDQSEFAPRQITIIAKEVITGTQMNIIHDGSTNLGALTIGDITLFPASVETAKTLAINKNYLLAGNTTERSEFDWDDQANVTITQVEYPMNVHYDATSCSLGGIVPGDVSPPSAGYNTPGATPAKSITPFSKWLVTAGTATYNAVVYTVNQVFTGVTGAGNDTATLSATGAIVPCVSINQYTTTAGASVPKTIQLKKLSDEANDCFWDYKSAAVSHLATGYWSGETYRYGLLAYDLKGNPFYVKWLGDYQFDSLLDKSGNLLRRDQIGNTGDYIYSINPSLVKLSGIRFTQAQIDRISGFSIVRAERDARIVAQGILTQNTDLGTTPRTFNVGAFVPVSLSNAGVVAKQYSFICPDELAGAPLKGDLGVVGDTLEEATWLEPYNYGVGVVRGSDFPTAAVAPRQIYTKFLSCVDDSSVRTATISYYINADEAESVAAGPTGELFINGMTTNAAGVNVEGNCVSGGADYTLNSFAAQGGKKSILTVETDFLHYGPAAFDYSSNNAAVTVLTEKILMNYVKSSYGTPYNGTGEASLANTLYISTGHYQPINSTVTSAVETAPSSGIFEFNDIEVGGGDCFPALVDYAYGLYDSTLGSPYSYAWVFPCECNANYNLRRGKKTSNVAMFYTGAADTNSIAYLSTASRVALESFAYNTGYSTEGQAVVYPATPLNFINSTEFQARIRYAGQKVIGENIDSFRTFGQLDFKDISSNYGRINDINVKEDKVIVWQDNAINTVPILERQVVSSDSGDATVLGTGGVVDRWDVISSFFGTQHQWSICETEYGFAWFDMRRKAFVILNFSGGLQEVSQIYGLKAFFDEVFLEIEGTQANDKLLLLNSTTFDDTSDRPLTGVGIISVYDPKFKMTYMTFKFMGQNNLSLKTKDFTIGYLHTDLKKCFVGFYDVFPETVHNHNGYVLMMNNPKNTTQYLLKSLVLTNYDFVVGDTLWGGSGTYKQIEYICIANVRLDNVAKYPEGASGATYWQQINKINQIWVLNQPSSLEETTAPTYVYNKYFGRVVDNQIDIIVNPKLEDDSAIEVQNISQNGTSQNYTDIYYTNTSQSASDLTITSTNRNFRFILDKITSSIAISSTGRLIDRYLKISFRKKNWTGSAPTVVSTSTKVLRSVMSWFTLKR